MHDSADAACQGTQPFCLPSQNLVGLAAGAEASLGPGPVLDGQQDAPRWTTRETEEQDRFAVYQMKVTICPRKGSHEWSSCPYAHPGETARRRDPRLHTGIACLSMKTEGKCALGDSCPNAHSAWEYWLHPSRYKTAICSQGPTCKRRFCFFAHHESELRRPAADRAGLSSADLVMAAIASTSTPLTTIPQQEQARLAAIDRLLPPLSQLRLQRQRREQQQHPCLAALQQQQQQQAKLVNGQWPQQGWPQGLAQQPGQASCAPGQYTSCGFFAAVNAQLSIPSMQSSGILGGSLDLNSSMPALTAGFAQDVHPLTGHSPMATPFASAPLSAPTFSPYAEGQVGGWPVSQAITSGLSTPASMHSLRSGDLNAEPAVAALQSPLLPGTLGGAELPVQPGLTADPQASLVQAVCGALEAGVIDLEQAAAILASTLPPGKLARIAETGQAQAGLPALAAPAVTGWL